MKAKGTFIIAIISILSLLFARQAFTQQELSPPKGSKEGSALPLPTKPPEPLIDSAPEKKETE